MIHVESASWGVRLQIGGTPSRQELSKLLDDLRKALPSSRPFFGAILDMGGAGSINPEHRDLLLQMVRFLHSRGMVRMAVGVPTSLTSGQMKRLSTEAGTLEGLRCMDAHDPNWPLLAEHWAVAGKEPETPSHGA
jgi:hypothetical protein